MERMAAAGEIDLDEFKLIAPKKHAAFPFLCSTTLYPEWPLAKVASTPDGVALQVVDALKKLKPTDSAAQKAKVVGWVDALDYGPIENLQASLKVGAFAMAQ